MKRKYIIAALLVLALISGLLPSPVIHAATVGRLLKGKNMTMKRIQAGGLFGKEVWVSDESLSDIEKLALAGTEIALGITTFEGPGQKEEFFSAIRRLFGNKQEPRYAEPKAQNYEQKEIGTTREPDGWDGETPIYGGIGWC